MTYDVRCTPHLWVTLPDGTRLAARLWQPEVDKPVPALVEYIPYRKSDGTAPSDPTRHAWFAAQGFACLRIDLRGSGDSDGYLLDEYHPREMQDGADAIAWVAAQPWCTGRVGMFGISWGGFNALQIAALRPPALRAVVSLCSTDDRYGDDVHYLGGCVEALDVLGWATQFTAFQSRPPLPSVRPDDWRDVWLARLRAMPHFAARWLAHPLRDAYWKHGSVCEDYSAIKCPVLLAGGWADGYPNAIPRMLANLQVPRVGIIGPWAHAWPDDARPGPRIDFLSESLNWWRRWLLSDASAAGDEAPALRAWEQDWVPPDEAHRTRPGRWRSGQLDATDGVRWHLAIGGALSEHQPPTSTGVIGSATTDLAHGIEGGAWCPFGGRADFPRDQCADDARALCFDSPAVRTAQRLFGRAALQLRVLVDKPSAQLVVRLCDVAPDGSSLLITRGVLDLGHRDAHSRREALPTATSIEVTLELDVIAHRLREGHHWRLAIATSYWPMVWPLPDVVRLGVLEGTLTLPHGNAVDVLGPAEITTTNGAAPLAIESLLAPNLQHTRAIEGGIAVRTRKLDSGTQRYPDGWTTSARSEDTHRISLTDPRSAEVHCVRESTLGDSTHALRTRVEGHVRCDATHFELTQTLVAWENDACVYRRSWFARLPR